MGLPSFGEWKVLNESRKRSRKSELVCPEPDDEEFCRKWNLYVNGKGPMPVKKKKVSLGHWEGRRGGDNPSASNVLRRKEREGEGRHKWRYDGG